MRRPSIEPEHAPPRSRAAAVLSVGDEQDVRESLAAALATVPPLWMEELILQTYQVAGFPRALNAMREWRRLVPEVPPADPTLDLPTVRARGDAACHAVYGPMYERLRQNVRDHEPPQRLAGPRDDAFAVGACTGCPKTGSLFGR